MNLKQRFANALWAQAVCDAVGDTFEFDIDPEPSDVLQYANNVDTLKITDDTQMALFGAEAIDNYHKLSVDVVSMTDHLIKSYVDWYKTQIFTFDYGSESECLLQFKSLFYRRAPGLTCLDSCSKLKYDIPVNNNSMGCGSVMRILPFVIFDNPEESLEHALVSAYLTHKHEINGKAVNRLMTTYNLAVKCGHVNQWKYLFDTNMSHISDLGTGWTALECVNMAIYANLHAKSFDELLTLSICHEGDSDSVAAIAGSIWGLCGKEVPIKYKQKIMESDAINYILNLETYKE